MAQTEVTAIVKGDQLAHTPLEDIQNYFITICGRNSVVGVKPVPGAAGMIAVHFASRSAVEKALHLTKPKIGGDEVTIQSAADLMKLKQKKR